MEIEARSSELFGEPTPLVGWRIWWLHQDCLHSWNLNYIWPPGTVQAECQAGRLLEPPLPTHHQAPGERCNCGLWALWSLSSCLNKARRERLLMAPGYFPVVGVIRAWGEVAVHGDEGFRAQYARVVCLVADSIWDHALDSLTRQPGQLMRLLARIVPRHLPRRQAALNSAANRYGIPVVPLEQGVRVGLFGELGARVA